MEITPIKSNQDYELALKKIESLFDAQHGTNEGDQLDILTTLVEKYEEEHFPMDVSDPLEALCFFMEQNSMTRSDLEPYIGSRARVSEVMNKKRSLTLPMIRKLHQNLDIPARILIQEYRL